MTLEEIFMQLNGGKSIDDSNLDSDTFTAQFCKNLAELWQSENLKRIAELQSHLDNIIHYHNLAIVDPHPKKAHELHNAIETTKQQYKK